MLGEALTINEFIVDSRSEGSVIGPLKVDVKGPLRSETRVDIKDNKNGTYNILYKPTCPGMYTMDIKVAEQDIPDSPLIIKVIELLSTWKKLDLNSFLALIRVFITKWVVS